MEPQPDTSRSDATADYSLTVEEASSLFHDAGVPRSPRTVMRYCAQEHLDCQKVDTDHSERYLISRESVDRRIQELQQVTASLAGHDATQRDTSRHDASGRDTSRHDEQTAELETRIKTLEAENLDLKITNRAKDQLIQMAREERASFLEKLSATSRTIGRLETRLRLALGAGEQPKEPPADAPFDESPGYPHDAASESSAPAVE